jgi:hypothetical protein
LIATAVHDEVRVTDDPDGASKGTLEQLAAKRANKVNAGRSVKRFACAIIKILNILTP